MTPPLDAAERTLREVFETAAEAELRPVARSVLWLLAECERDKARVAELEAEVARLREVLKTLPGTPAEVALATLARFQLIDRAEAAEARVRELEGVVGYLGRERNEHRARAQRLEDAIRAFAAWWSDVEPRSAEAHAVYQKEAHRRGDVRHPDAYDDLSEPTKEWDRVLVRWVADTVRERFAAALHDADHPQAGPSSEDAGLQNPPDRGGTCARCHLLEDELRAARDAYAEHWDPLPGDSVADLMRCVIGGYAAKQARFRARGAEIDVLRDAIRRAPHSLDCRRTRHLHALMADDPPRDECYCEIAAWQREVLGEQAERKVPPEKEGPDAP